MKYVEVSFKRYRCFLLYSVTYMDEDFREFDRFFDKENTFISSTGWIVGSVACPELDTSNKKIWLRGHQKYDDNTICKKHITSDEQAAQVVLEVTLTIKEWNQWWGEKKKEFLINIQNKKQILKKFKNKETIIIS